MNWLVVLWRRVRMLMSREDFDRDLQEEMRLHQEERAREFAAGNAMGDASYAVRRRFGNEGVLREQCRDAWGWRWLDDFEQDVRFGFRNMWRTPGFTAIAVIALALGIGATTAIFSVVNAVLLRPLAYKDSSRLVVLLHHGSDPVSVANFLDWKKQQNSFDDLAAADYWTPNLTGMDPPERITGLRVTANMFPLLGVEPLLGRAFLAGEDAPGREYEVVLSCRLWQRRFAGDRAVLGRTISLNGHAYTIVGVMPASFQFAPFWATRAELWAPDVLADRATQRGGNSLRVFARLKPGISLETARAEIATITARLQREYPGTNGDVRVVQLMEKVVGQVRPALLVLLGAVAFVLLIACSNVAHMLLARAATRQREIAIRSALGAGRQRIIRQFLSESLLLASIGACTGLLLGTWGIHGLIALSPGDIPRLETVGLDARVLLFVLGATMFTGMLFGLAPAVQSAAVQLSEALKEGGRGGMQGHRSSRLRTFLVASEFALALMLLIGAGLLIRSFAALRAIDPGFDPHNLLSMVVSVAGSAESPAARRGAFYRELLDKIRVIPGVQAASAINHLPLAGETWGFWFRIAGQVPVTQSDTPNAIYRVIMPGYFQTMHVPLLRGRDIGDVDVLGKPGVVIINQEAARRYFPGKDPVGMRVTFDDPATNPHPEWLTIVGVSANTRQTDWTAPIAPEIFVPYLQNRAYLENPGPQVSYITLVLRADGDAAALTAAVKNTVWSIDRALPISEVVTMDDVISAENARPRFELLLLSLFGGLALTLAAVGIYGVMSYAVSRRTHEIAVRLSLGASRRQILSMMLLQGMILALAGSGFGIAGALLLSKFMTKLLYGVRPTDPLTYLAVSLLLAAIALLATYLPARRATGVDPIVALRSE